MSRVGRKLFVLSSLLLLAGCNAQEPAPTPKASLKVASDPTKVNYNCGNNFDKTGLTLEYTDVEGNKTTVTDFTLSGDKNLKASTTSVTASYRGLSVDVDIEVSNVIEGQITCVGDSLTEGHYWSSESYPNYIKGNFDDSSKMTISNCGKNGASFKTFGEYNPAYNTTSQYQTSLTGNPIVLTILLGTNDATNWANEADDYVADYTALVNLYRTTFGEDLNIIMLTSPRCITNTFGIPTDVICNDVVPLQKQLAEDLNCPLIDLNGEFDNYTDAELFRPNDGVHFTVKAAEITAKLISEKIKDIYEIE